MDYTEKTKEIENYESIIGQNKAEIELKKRSIPYVFSLLFLLLLVLYNYAHDFFITYFTYNLYFLKTLIISFIVIFIFYVIWIRFSIKKIKGYNSSLNKKVYRLMKLEDN